MLMGYFKGVSRYVKATLELGFPDGECFCWHCPLLHHGRQICLKSGEIIEDVRSLGKYCELVFHVEEEENDGISGNL